MSKKSQKCGLRKKVFIKTVCYFKILTGFELRFGLSSMNLKEKEDMRKIHFACLRPKELLLRARAKKALTGIKEKIFLYSKKKVSN